MFQLGGCFHGKLGIYEGICAFISSNSGMSLPKSRCRYLGTEKGGPSTVTDLKGNATQLWYFAALSIWSSLPSWFAWYQILLNLFLRLTTNCDCGIVWNVLTRCWKSPLLSKPCYCYNAIPRNSCRRQRRGSLGGTPRDSCRRRKRCSLWVPP